MGNGTTTSSKVFSGIYMLLAAFSAILSIQSLLSGQAFADFRGVIFITVGVVTFFVTSIAAWVKWNDSFPYNYETPYKISKTTIYLKAVYGAFAISLAIFMVAIVISLYLFEFRSISGFIEKYLFSSFALSTALLFPFVRKYMK